MDSSSYPASDAAPAIPERPLDRVFSPGDEAPAVAPDAQLGADSIEQAQAAEASAAAAPSSPPPSPPPSAQPSPATPADDSPAPGGLMDEDDEIPHDEEDADPQSGGN